MAGWRSSLKQKDKITWDGDLHARNFVGDGSGLTNVTAPASDDWTVTATQIYPKVSSLALVASAALISGNVGIGSTAPVEKLDVIGNIFIGFSVGASRQLRLYGRDSVGVNSIIDYYAGVGNPFIISTSINNNDIYLKPHGTGRTIITNGNVGIGTTSPQFQLHQTGRHGFNNTTEPSVVAETASGALYVSSGALYFKSSGGTVTKIAEA